MSTNIDSNEWSDAAALEKLANEFFKTVPGRDSFDGLLPQQFPQTVSPATGVSPLAVERNTTFDIKDPQSSLPDPHFEDGKIPASVAGSGRLPSVQQPSGSLARPSETQIPFDGVSQAAYYFLNGANPFSLNGANPLNGVNPRNGHAGLTQPPFDVAAVRNDFPILKELVNGRPLIWLDNAATTQKPRQVIDRISHFYSHENSNIHRAAHELAARATDAYEGARKKVQEFINAASVNEIIFVRGATEAINLVAKSWGEQHLVAGDEIIVSHLEHHANIVPWQQLAEKKGIKLKVIPVDDDGQILLDEYAKLLSNKTRLVSVTQVSNALGTITPVRQIADMAHGAGAKVLVDGAQSVSHMPVDVRDIGADWFVFSGHKVFAPTGIGVVYGREDLLNATQPWQGGGNMIKDVTFEHTQYQNAPGRFEAGTGNIADAVGLGAAIDYVTRIGMNNIDTYEHYLLVYATKLLKDVPGLRLIGTAKDKASVLSFVLNGFTNDQVGQALNKEGIAVRTGHHCAQPILRRFGLESTVRPSLAFYNTCADVDALVSVLHRLRGRQ
jgi:cysteine desulfurase/selenocysteine lyase